MKTMNFEQMEKVNGGLSDGYNCLISLGGTAVAFAEVVTATAVTGGAAAIFAFGYLSSGVGIGVSCNLYCKSKKLII